jgi:hypothetical protein
LLCDKSADVRLRTLQYLVDRRDGKPTQALHVDGSMAHTHMELRNLSEEELQERIHKIEEELGDVRVPGGKASLLLEGESVTPAEPLPQPAPQRWDTPPARPEPTPPTPAAIPQVYCDKHGPFRPTSKMDVACPACRLQWDTERVTDDQRLASLLPGTPEWSRR